MKKVIAWLLVLALTAAVSIGATLAYLTDTDEDVNVMTLGKVKIDQLEYERIDDETKDEDAKVQEFHDNKPLYPGVYEDGFDFGTDDNYVNWEQIDHKDGYTSGIWHPDEINNEVDKMVFVENTGDYDAYVRSVFAFEAGNYETLEEFQKMVHLNLNKTNWTWEWAEEPVTIGESKYFVATATYNNVLASGALTEISLSQIALDKTATNADVEAFGETYQVLVKSQGIQADGFTDAKTALDEGFGEILKNIGTEDEPKFEVIPNDFPFENDTPTKGIDMITAVNNYNGKSITSKVQSIVFGKNADHSEIAAQNEGVLVDVEQDVPVYAYYVENNGLYQIYLLADDTIYLPTNATKMFNGMSKLTTMEVDNLSTERTTTFKGLFQNCNKLKELDVSKWDVSNVTDMIAAFNWCYELNLIGYENWDTSKVTNMAMLFQSNRAATEMDLSNWDLSSVTTTASMFQDCTSLTNLDTTGWNTESVTTMYQMFADCKKLTNIEGTADWDTSNVNEFSKAFYACRELESLDISDWDTGNGIAFNSLFSSCNKLILDKDELKGWDMSKAEKINHMFYECRSIQELNLSGWNMPNMTTTSHMFADCDSLNAINFDGWYTPSLDSMDCMFNDCENLTYLNLSSFDTSKCREFSQIFERCTSLVKIEGLDQWDTTNGRTFEETFRECYALEELDLSTFNTRSVVNDYPMQIAGTGWGYKDMFLGTNGLNKLTLSADFSFDGDGKVTTESYKVALPAPNNAEGKWYDAEGNAYEPSKIPEETAATYYAVNPVNP